MLSLLFQITCEALNAHPAPQLNWEEPQDADVDVSAQPTITTNDITTNIRHKIKYKAQLKDDGGEIKCIGTQVCKNLSLRHYWPRLVYFLSSKISEVYNQKWFQIKGGL